MPVAAAAEPLDERLVEVALRLLEREGIEELSLRRVAREAGVSHGAPLRHFQGIDDLRAQVAARGFRLLSQALEGSSSALPPGSHPLARLAAAGRAYVQAAVENPDLFALMFRPDALDTSNPVFAAESGAAFEQLVRHVRAAQDAGFESGRDTRQLASTVWAAVHGLATLWSQGALQAAASENELDSMLATLMQLMLPREQGDNR